MILKVASDPAQRHAHTDADLGQVVGSTNAREHQQLRRVDGAAAEDDLARGVREPGAAAAQILDPDGAAILDCDARGMRPCPHRQVAPAQCGMQIPCRCARAAAVADGPLAPAEAFLADPVVIFREGMPGLDAGRNVGLVQRINRFGAADMERPAPAAQLGLAVFPGFRALEVGQQPRE